MWNFETPSATDRSRSSGVPARGRVGDRALLFASLAAAIAVLWLIGPALASDRTVLVASLAIGAVITRAALVAARRRT